MRTIAVADSSDVPSRTRLVEYSLPIKSTKILRSEGRIFVIQRSSNQSSLPFLTANTLFVLLGLPRGATGDRKSVLRWSFRPSRLFVDELSKKARGLEDRIVCNSPFIKALHISIR
jgi:hypothetical protein